MSRRPTRTRSAAAAVLTRPLSALTAFNERMKERLEAAQQQPSSPL